MTSSPDAAPSEDQLRREAFELLTRSARLRAESEKLSARAEELFLQLAALSRTRNSDPGNTSDLPTPK